jgi:periplasmic protein TonB
MRNNARTRTSSLTVQARIWVDANGRIERARLVGSSGDNNLDDEIARQVLTGIQLTSPPPSGMKMPITLRITARKSS